MGRPIFERFLTELADGRSPHDRGVYLGDEFASWHSLLLRGSERSRLVEPNRSYIVDPTVGMEVFASFFAVATVPDTLLLWTRPAIGGASAEQIAPGLYRVDEPERDPLTRPLWGVASSGTTGTPKLTVGWGDQLELVAAHYDRAVYLPRFPHRGVDVLATCLPLEFSAAFFMSALPAMLLCRDLLVFPPHDWRPVEQAAKEANVTVLAVPAIAAAASIGSSQPMDFSQVAMLLGAGYLTAERVHTIQQSFHGTHVHNLYGTAETGAISIDSDPGHCLHVGRPLPGKSVWVLDPDENGIGPVASVGPDCCSWYWGADSGLERASELVASTDLGHFDPAGNLCLDGRVDGGEKLFGVTIYPRQVERHILALDGVVDARVKISNRASGTEHLMAQVVGDVDERAVAEHCGSLPELLRPSRIDCLTEVSAASAYTAHGKL